MGGKSYAKEIWTQRNVGSSLNVTLNRIQDKNHKEEKGNYVLIKEIIEQDYTIVNSYVP